MKKLLLTALVVATVHAIARAQIVPGQNSNVNPGVVDEFVGDKFLQRQVEPKMVCASNNSQLCLAIANDYRTVDENADPGSGFGEGLASLMRALFGPKYTAVAPPDAWLGLYRTSNGTHNWLNGLVPGFPQDTSALGAIQPWKIRNLPAASDGGLASDGVRFYGVGLFFERGGPSMIGAFRLTAFNDESAFPIRWDSNGSRTIQSSATNGGLFTDLPTILADPPRAPNAACGRVYIGFTQFAPLPSQDSSLYVSTSSDCGVTYSAPLKISGNIKKNQRIVFAVDPKPGTPPTTGGGTVYAVWRSFEPDRIYMAKSINFGQSWSSPIPITSRSGPANLCTYDQPTRGINETSDPNQETARALAFASAQVDSLGILHVVWTERVDSATGLPLAGAACQANKQPKIVYTSSVDGGSTWRSRKAVDKGARCETAAGPGQVGGLDRSAPNGQCAAGTIARPSGVQIQPALSHNAGKLMLLYSEGRANPQTGQFLAAGYHSGRNTQMDIRAARLNPLNGALLATTQVSQYAIDVSTNDIKTVESPSGTTNPPNAKAYNRSYLLQYKGGTIPFKGDHDDLTAAETVIWTSIPHVGMVAYHATPLDVIGMRFYGIWGGDNRESLFANGDLFNGDWTNYVDPGMGGQPPCNAGIRNSNNYVAYVGSQLEAFVHQSFKPPLDVNGDKQRTWVVTVRNRSSQLRTVKLLLDDQFLLQIGGDASFDQSQDVEIIGNNPSNPSCAGAAYPGCTAFRTIQPHSNLTFTVFGEITNPTVAAPFKIAVFEATLSPGPTPVVTQLSLAAIVRLNPNPNNPAPLAGADITTEEHHGPEVEGPFVDTRQNPTQGNPTQGNPTQGNPTQGNPTQGNAGFGEYTDYTFKVRAAGANTLSQYSAFANIANAEEVDASHLVQMIITRRHMVPTLNASDPNCPPTERVEDEVISTVTVPGSGDLGVPTQGNPTQGNPTQGNPTQGNPTQGNPTQGNPTQGNNTFAIAPSELPEVGEGASARYRATALASAVQQAVSSLASDIGPDGTAVGSPGIDETHVTFRFFHCRVGSQCGLRADGTPFQTEALANEIVPRTCAAQPCGPNEAASSLTGLVVIAGAGDNDNGVVTPPQFVGAGPDLSASGPEGPFTVSPSTIVAGDTVTFSSFVIANQGTSAAGPFTYRFFAQPGTGAPTALGGSIPSEGGITIAAGGTAFRSSTLRAIPAELPVGTYATGPLVDSGNDVAETDEFNNFLSATLTVVAPPVITTTSLPNATAGTAYSQTLAATGGVNSPGYTWSITSGALPPGLSLNASTGEISGMPLNGGHTHPFEVQAADNASPPHVDTQSLSISVVGASIVVLNTDMVSAGVGGMRVDTGSLGEPQGDGGGTITLPEFGGTVSQALLYWNGPTSSTDPTVNGTVFVNDIEVTGVNIGFASSNCWGPPEVPFTNSQSYRADVTTIVQEFGNGDYVLSNFAKGAAADINGASLIVFYNDGSSANDRNVYISDGNDSNVASPFEVGSWNSTVYGINYNGGPWLLQLHITDAQVAQDGAWSLNGTQVEPAGPNFEGASVPSAGSIFPGWDLRSFTSPLTLSVGSNNLTLTDVPASDCIGVVVIVVSVPTVPPPPIP